MLLSFKEQTISVIGQPRLNQAQYIASIANEGVTTMHMYYHDRETLLACLVINKKRRKETSEKVQYSSGVYNEFEII